MLSSATSATFNPTVTITSGGVTVSTTTLTPFGLTGTVPALTGSAPEFSGDVTIGATVTSVSESAMSGTIQYTDNSGGATLSWPFQAAPGGSGGGPGPQIVSIYAVPAGFGSDGPIPGTTNVLSSETCNQPPPAQVVFASPASLEGPFASTAGGSPQLQPVNACMVNGAFKPLAYNWSYSGRPRKLRADLNRYPSFG